jgi:hypothetical protein
MPVATKLIGCVLVVHAFACLGGFLSGEAKAADPAKDPLGWGDLRFGMTPEQVLKALGPRAGVRRPETPRPLMLDDKKTPDIPQALEIAKNLIDDPSAKAQDAKIGESKALLSLVKRRGWRGSPANNSGNEAKTPKTISGILESFSDDESSQRFVLIRPANPRMPPVALLRGSLDSQSQAYVKEIEDSVYDLSESIWADERRIAELAPLDPNSIEVESVRISEITLVPEVLFRGGKLWKVNLHTPGADNPTTPYNSGWMGMFLTLRNALSEKYGAPDEQGRGDSGEFAAWRFPRTLISCRHGRHGIWVTYEEEAREDSKNPSGL